MADKSAGQEGGGRLGTNVHHEDTKCLPRMDANQCEGRQLFKARGHLRSPALSNVPCAASLHLASLQWFDSFAESFHIRIVGIEAGILAARHFADDAESFQFGKRLAGGGCGEMKSLARKRGGGNWLA